MNKMNAIYIYILKNKIIIKNKRIKNYLILMHKRNITLLSIKLIKHLFYSQGMPFILIKTTMKYGLNYNLFKFLSKNLWF